MRRCLFVLLFISIVCSGLFTESADLERADFLYDESRNQEGLELMLSILPKASTNREKSEIYWRLAQFTLEVTDDLEKEGASKDRLLEGFVQGEKYATTAIELNRNSHLGYYWRSANTGRWGQTKGILDSLFKASPMRDDLIKAITIEPDHGDSWYVLGRLYSEVPGIISFGNNTNAISLDRKAIDNQEGPDPSYGYYVEFAKHLMKRDWKASKRNRSLDKMKRNYNNESVFFDKHRYYEGTVDFSRSPEYSRKALEDLSDEQEASDVLNWLKRELESIRDRTGGEEDNLTDVLELLEELD